MQKGIAVNEGNVEGVDGMSVAVWPNQNTGFMGRQRGSVERALV